MKKALVLVSLASLAAVSFGCAVTDYPAFPAGPANKSHGLVGCASNDRFANSQQTIERETRNMLYTTSYGMDTTATAGWCGPTSNILNFDPIKSVTNVGIQDARDWNRFNAAWSFFGEIIVTGAEPNGEWMMMGLKDLADGSMRVNNLHTDDPGVASSITFSCVGAGVNGRYGGPEGVVYGDGYNGRLPGLHIDALVIDSSPNTFEWCGNIAAVSADTIPPDPFTPYFSIYWGFFGNAYEGHLAATPITRRQANLGLLLQGTPQTIDNVIEDLDVTLKGNLNADGTITVEILGLQNGLASYQAEQPFKLTVNPANHFKTVKVENPSTDELVRLCRFGVESGMSGRSLDVNGKMIADLGFNFPPAKLMLSTAWMTEFQRHPQDFFH